MAQMTVDSTPTRVPLPAGQEGILVLQNVDDASDVWFGHEADVDGSTGMKLTHGDSYEFPRGGFGSVYVMSTGTADLRWMLL